MSNTNNSGVRDVQSNRGYTNGLGAPDACGIVTLTNAANTDFTPVPNGIHAMVPTAARALTITQASASKTSLRVGEGFRFWIHNNSAGAFAITLVAGGGANVATEGTSLLVVAQGQTGEFALFRSSATVHQLVSLGIRTH